MANRFFYVSDSHPAGEYNDQKLLSTYIEDYKTVMQKGEVTIADGAFSKDAPSTMFWGKNSNIIKFYFDGD